MAERLKEHSKESGENLTVAGIIAASSDEAQATATVMWDVLSEKNFGPAAWLPLRAIELLQPKFAFNSPSFRRGGAAGFTQELNTGVGREVASLMTERKNGNAILIVGHQPILGWLSYVLVGEAHPIANSELLCLDIETSHPARLCWTISPSDPKAALDLQEKIRSKMEVAKLLSSFLGGGLSFLLATMANVDAAKQLWGHIWAFALGSVLLIGALGFFLWTMCSYDSLLMPSRMWAETPRGDNAHPRWLVARPPSPVHWILYQNMLRIWQWQFKPATALMLAGLWLLASAVFGARLTRSTLVAVSYYSFLAVVAMATILIIAWRCRYDLKAAAGCTGMLSKIRHLCGPWLGSED